MSISCYTCVRNAIELDYPVHLTIDSMLPCCEEVVVGVAESTDGTLEWLQGLYKGNPKVRLVEQPWTEPKGQLDWWVRWIQETQKHLRFEQQLFLDADEVLDPSSIPILRDAPKDRCYWLRRLNYWK